MAEFLQMTAGGHSLVIKTCDEVHDRAPILIDIWVDGNDEKTVQMPMCMAEAKALHAALEAVIAATDWEYQVGMERQKSEWRHD